jgi:hypothetical protein
MNRLSARFIISVAICSLAATAYCQRMTSGDDSVKFRKNVLRYNLSGALIFGFDKNLVFGYERVTGKHQSISINAGKISFPRIISIITDSFSLGRDVKNTGVNLSVDYRFYLSRENKHHPPRGLYIGPYYSFNRYTRDNEFSFKRSSGNTQLGTSNTTFTINTIGGELGYQFVLWKRLALDFVMVGPGLSNYDISTKFDGPLTDDERKQLREATREVMTQRFPGMNFVLGDKEIDADGTLSTWSLGFRYLVHIGFVF